MSQLIWAPEMHRINGKWYIYFAATHTQALDKLGMFQHRMLAPECADADPLTGKWTEKGQIKTPFDTFALDATTFYHQGKQWYLWAQKRRILPVTQIFIWLNWKIRGRLKASR